MTDDRSPRPADVSPEDATPNDAGAPEGTPTPLEDAPDVKGPEERLDERLKREKDG